MCEYRFYLQEEHGQKASRASIEGSRLHESIATNDPVNKEHNQMIPIAIIILAIVIGYLWIFG